MSRRYVPVAEVARPHGVHGELRLKVFNQGSDLLLRRPPIKLRLADGTTRDASIKSARGVNKGILVTLADVEGREAAEALRGAYVLVPRDAFPPPEEGELYACDLEGARVVMASTGEEIGRVSAVQTYPTCDAIVVERAKDSAIEVPLVDAYIEAIDVSGAVVKLVTLEGLL